MLCGVPEGEGGRQIGDYQIVQDLEAQGRDVCLARPLGKDKPDLVLLAAFEVGEEEARVLQQEVRRCRGLWHPAIMQLVNQFEHDGKQVFVFEHLPGTSLYELMQHLSAERERLADSAIFHIGKCLFEALNEAHTAMDEAGKISAIAHGQLGPHQVFLSWKGEVKIFGFGMSTVFRLAESLESMPEPLRPYLAPETREGYAPTPRANVYSAAAIVWALLAGRDAPATINSSERLEKLRPEVPRRVAMLLEQALEPSVMQRHTAAMALAKALEEAAGSGGARELQWNMEAYQAQTPMAVRVLPANSLPPTKLTGATLPPEKPRPSDRTDVSGEPDLPDGSDESLADDALPALDAGEPPPPPAPTEAEEEDSRPDRAAVQRAAPLPEIVPPSPEEKRQPSAERATTQQKQAVRPSPKERQPTRPKPSPKPAREAPAASPKTGVGGRPPGGAAAGKEPAASRPAKPVVAERLRAVQAPPRVERSGQRAVAIPRPASSDQTAETPQSKPDDEPAEEPAVAAPDAFAEAAAEAPDAFAEAEAAAADDEPVEGPDAEEPDAVAEAKEAEVPVESDRAVDRTPARDGQEAPARRALPVKWVTVAVALTAVAFFVIGLAVAPEGADQRDVEATTAVETARPAPTPTSVPSTDTTPSAQTTEDDGASEPDEAETSTADAGEDEPETVDLTADASELPSDMGFLTVRTSLPKADVFVNGIRAGAANQKLAIRCGVVAVSLRVSPKGGTHGQPRTVQVKCQDSTYVFIGPKPSGASRPGAAPKSPRPTFVPDNI